MSSLQDDLLRLITTDIARDDRPVEPGTELLLSGIVDSLGVVRIVHWMEDRLGLAIAAGDVTLEHFESVTAMVRYADGRLTPSA